MRWVTVLLWTLGACAAQLPACRAGNGPDPIRREPYAGVAAAIEQGLAPATTSVLVMRAGAIEYEQYFAGADAATLHDVRSTSKSLTALAIGIAIDERRLSGVAAPVLDYFSELGPFEHDGPAKRAITVEDLLTMSSAFDCDDDVESSPGNEERMYPKQSWARWVLDLPTLAGYARDASGRGPWRYCTAGTFLLGQLLEHVTHTRADHYLAERLFAPLGITRWQFSRSPSGEVQTGGQLRLSTRDLGRLGWLVRSGGNWRGRQVVSAAWIREALSVRRNAFPGQDYGYQFWHQRYDYACGSTEAWYMSGNGGNTVVMFNDLDAVVVVTRTHYNQRGMHAQTKTLITTEILPALACTGASASTVAPGRGRGAGE